MEQEGLAIVLIEDFFVNNLDEHRAELSAFLIGTTSSDFVKFIEWHLIYNFLHVLFRVRRLDIIEMIILVSLLYLLP